MRHYENSILIPVSPEELFAYIDDHANFSSHMSQSSWMMGGGHMNISVDEGHGQKVGSHIRLEGSAFGMKIFLDEVITQHEPPVLKTWETIGNLKLLVIGHYRMGIEIKPQENQSLLRVFIDYDLPTTNAWLGRLFGGSYAKWCVKQMLKGASNHFSSQPLAAKSKKIMPVIIGMTFIAAFIYFVAVKNNNNNNAPAQPLNETIDTTLQSQTNNEGGVSIDATPLGLTAGKPAQFEIKFTTHQGDLNFDLLKQAVLIDENNTNYTPLSWDGGTGGHHIDGTLTFPALNAETKNIKLIIKDIYNIPERVFEWKLK